MPAARERLAPVPVPGGDRWPRRLVSAYVHPETGTLARVAAALGVPLSRLVGG